MSKIKVSYKNNAIDKRIFFRLIKFNSEFIKRDVVFWILLFLFIFSNIISTTVLLILDKSNILNYSLLNYLISFLFNLIFILFSVYKLFLVSKYSSVDLNLNSKSFNRITIYLSRFSLIMLFSFFVNVIHFLVSSILILSFNLQSSWVLYSFISNILINTFISTFLISLFVLFVIYLKKILFFAFGLISILFFSLPLVTRSFNTSVDLNYSTKTKNSYIKLIELDDNSQKTIISKKINFALDDKSNNYDVNLDNFWNYLIPGEWVSSLTSSLLSNTIHYDNVSNVKFKYSLIKTWYKNINYINFENKTIMTLLTSDVNPLNYSNTEYENLLIDNFSHIATDKECLNLFDSLLVASFLNKLKNNAIWNKPNLSFKEFTTLSKLFGFDKRNSQLFYYWNYYDLLSKKTPNLFTKLEQTYGNSFVDLLKYIYTSSISYTNIFNFNIFGNVEDYYPISKVINEQKPINQNDLDFIINDLIRFNENVISYLDVNNSYQITTIKQIQKISSKVTNFTSWKQYVLENTITYNQADMLINNVIDNLDNAYTLKLQPNYFDPYQYSNYYKQTNFSYLDYNYLVLSLFICLTLYINYVSISKFRKMNYKYIEL